MSMPRIIVRREEDKDFDDVYNIVKEAFAVAEHSDGNEQDLVVRLRRSKVFIPELSLVAEVNDKVIGHIMFTKLKVGKTEQLCLAPLSVMPEYQGKGIGGMLINEGHKVAKSLNYDFSIVIGYPQYYSRFGYVDAEMYSIRAPFDLPKNVFMACDLSGYNLKIDAIVEYSEEFFVRDDL